MVGFTFSKLHMVLYLCQIICVFFIIYVKLYYLYIIVYIFLQK